MFKTIIATCLLTFSCSSGSLKVETPKRALNQTTITGNYCWQTDFDFDDYEYAVDDTIYLDTDFENLCPFYFGDENGMVYLHHIYFDCSSEGFFVDFQWFTTTSTTLNSKSFNVYTGNDWTDTGYPELHFYLFNQYYLDVDMFDTFNHLFSHEANPSIYTYNGYYTINRQSTLTNNIGVTGYIIFDNIIYFNMYHYRDNLFNYIAFQKANNYVDVNGQSTPKVVSQSTPMGTTVQAQIYFNGVMMSQRSKERLNAVGVFNYVADHNNEGFYDLMYSVVDSPIRFLMSLMSFDLLGVSFFYAFIGLVTLIVLVAVIKKVA